MTANIRKGLEWGLWYSVVYSGYAILLRITAGNEPFEAVGTSFPKALSAYLVAGLVSGFVFGLVLPLARWWWGAMLAGSIAGFPAMYIVALTMDRTAVGPDPFFIALWGGALTLGPVCGLGMWYVNQIIRSPRKR